MFGRPILLGVTAISTAGLLLAGCSSTSSSEPSQTTPASEQAFDSATQAKFQAALDTLRTKFNYPGAQAPRRGSGVRMAPGSVSPEPKVWAALSHQHETTTPASAA